MSLARLSTRYYDAPAVEAPENGLTITITGRVASGKTTIAAIIADALFRHGISVQLNKVEESHNDIMGTPFDVDRIADLRKKLNGLGDLGGVVINQQNLARHKEPLKFWNPPADPRTQVRFLPEPAEAVEPASMHFIPTPNPGGLPCNDQGEALPIDSPFVRLPSGQAGVKIGKMLTPAIMVGGRNQIDAFGESLKTFMGRMAAERQAAKLERTAETNEEPITGGMPYHPEHVEGLEPQVTGEELTAPKAKTTGFWDVDPATLQGVIDSVAHLCNPELREKDRMRKLQADIEAQADEISKCKPGFWFGCRPMDLDVNPELRKLYDEISEHLRDVNPELRKLYDEVSVQSKAAPEKPKSIREVFDEWSRVTREYSQGAIREEAPSTGKNAYLDMITNPGGFRIGAVPLTIKPETVGDWASPIFTFEVVPFRQNHGTMGLPTYLAEHSDGVCRCGFAQ